MRTALLILSLAISVHASSQLMAIKLQVSGLTCAMCARTVQNSLEKIVFIKEVRPDLNSQEYQLSLRENDRVDLDLIRKEVEDAGFSVARLQVTAFVSDAGLQNRVPVKIGSLLFQIISGDQKLAKGENTFMLAEQGFLSAKTLKKYCGDPQQKCMADRSSKDGERVYRVIVV